MSQTTLPLIPLPYPLILLPGSRVTFPISHKQANALIRLLDSSPSDPVLAAVPLLQHEGATTLNRWGVTARVARFVRPRPHSDEPYILTLTGTARVRLADGSNPPSHAVSVSVSPDALSLPRFDVVYPPPDAHSPPAPDVVQDFKAAAGRLLERFAQDTSQSARKRESWVRIAQLVDETEPERTAALADAIVTAVGAEHADKLGEQPPLLSFGDLSLSAPPPSVGLLFCLISLIATCGTRIRPVPSLRKTLVLVMLRN